MTIRHVFFALLFVTSMLAGCARPGIPQVELPDDGAPIAVSQGAAVSFIQKSTAAAQSAANTGSATVTLTQEEVTSFIAIGSQLAVKLQEVQNIENLQQIDLQDLEQLQGVTGIEGLENLEQLRQLQEQREQLPGLPNLQLPDLSLRMELTEPQVYFKGDGHIIFRGNVGIRGRSQPVRIVTAPRAAGGELVLDFVEGTLGPVPVPEQVFDVVGSGLARAILAGQDYAEISEISVGEGVLTISGRRVQ